MKRADLKENRLYRQARKPTAKWKQAFREMAIRADDRLIDESQRTLTLWDETEWQWSDSVAKTDSDNHEKR